MKTEDKNTSITFRTTEKLRKALETMALKENRNLSNMIESLLEKAVNTSHKK